MALSSLIVADVFLKKAFEEGSPVTPLKLQKLIYFAHGWYLGLTGEPLISECARAWKFGPVFPTVYQEFKTFGNKPISRTSGAYSPNALVNPDLIASLPLLERVWQVYSKFTATQLSTLSHQSGGPWHQTVAKAQWGSINNQPIENELIRSWFARK